MEQIKRFCSKLEKDKIKINWNKKPIPMKLFLSFLTVKVERQKVFLGYDNGWTRLDGAGGLVVSGGIVKGVEYLDSLRYGDRLDNPYNHFVNPFYLFGILSEEGRKFFLDYYKDDIDTILAKAQEQYRRAKANKKETFEFWEILNKNTPTVPTGTNQTGEV